MTNITRNCKQRENNRIKEKLQMVNIDNIAEVKTKTLGEKIKNIFRISSNQLQHQQQIKLAEQLIRNQINNKMFSFTPYKKCAKGTTYRLEPSKWRED
jgi:hypothetical protein